ncbi:hypothetical protein [Klebsiella pneumoniae]|uniref:hypothetical protein n=1 Tax=Klebsiella pneumoniae TaxID=573 RepID=UPI0021C212BF|nr:hypothetical protein [Klebsiella pneumoniae]MCT8909441.1 hypothetical protein [Klebsiella pneumoniae]
MTDITELAQSLKAAAVRAKTATDEYASGHMSVSVCYAECEEFNRLTDGPDNILALVEALEKAQRANEYLREQSAEWERKAISNFEECAEMSARIDELESQRKLAFSASNRWADKFREAEQRIAETEAQNDYFASLVAMARVSADKAIRKFPQPNYVLLKVAEEAGEVVQAGVHYAENRMEWGQVEGEIVQLLAMLIRLVTEGDQVNGITPPALCSAGIKVEVE